MRRELLMLVDAVARVKNVDKDIVFASLELARASARVFAGGRFSPMKRLRSRHGS